MEFTNKDGIKLVDEVISTIQENRDYLSQIDGELVTEIMVLT